MTEFLEKAPSGFEALSEEADPRLDPIGARDRLIDAAEEAGRIALKFFRSGERTSARVEFKTGGSPVTEADIAVDEFLASRLGAAYPSAGWLSEETQDDLTRLGRPHAIIVDPIDGTRAFLAGDPRWAVSIAFIVEGRPVAGVVHAPALGETYAAATGRGSTLNGTTIGASSLTELPGARIAGPKQMVEAIGRAIGGALLAQPKIPSLAYRLALVASGALDLALASEKSHDWDIAAADLLLAEAGGLLVDAAGRGLRYNRAETRHGVLFGAPRPMIAPFVAAGRIAAGAPLA